MQSSTPSWRDKRRTKKSVLKPLGERLGDALKLALAIVSLMGLGLACSGFGVALALTTTFELHLAEVLHGPLDYVAVSAYVVLELFTTVRAFIEDEKYLSLLWMILGPGIVAGVAFLWVCLSFFKDERVIQSKPVQVARTGAIGLWRWVVSLGKLRRVWGYLGHGLCLVALLWAVFGTGRATVMALLGAAIFLYVIADWRSSRIGGVSLGVGAGYALVSHVLPHLGLTLVAVTLIPFVVSFDSAKRYIHEAVIEPVSCSPLLDAKSRRQRWMQAQMKSQAPAAPAPMTTAKCVQIDRKGHFVRQGREVIATADLVVLFDPISGAVQTVPRKDAVVTTIDRLTPANILLSLP
jgi:hypothetical protein